MSLRPALATYTGRSLSLNNKADRSRSPPEVQQALSLSPLLPNLSLCSVHLTVWPDPGKQALLYHRLTARYTL